MKNDRAINPRNKYDPSVKMTRKFCWTCNRVTKHSIIRTDKTEIKTCRECGEGYTYERRGNGTQSEVQDENGS